MSPAYRFLIANVLWINQYPDYEADKSGENELWSGYKKEVVKGLRMFGRARNISLIAVIYMEPFWLLGLITAPLAYAVKTQS